jgi:hypothetical protein
VKIAPLVLSDTGTGSKNDRVLTGCPINYSTAPPNCQPRPTPPTPAFCKLTLDWAKAQLQTLGWAKAQLQTLDWAKAQLQTLDWAKAQLQTLDWAKAQLQTLGWAKAQLQTLDWAKAPFSPAAVSASKIPQSTRQTTCRAGG